MKLISKMSSRVDGQQKNCLSLYCNSWIENKKFGNWRNIITHSIHFEYDCIVSKVVKAIIDRIVCCLLFLNRQSFHVLYELTGLMNCLWNLFHFLIRIKFYWIPHFCHLHSITSLLDFTYLDSNSALDLLQILDN